MRPIGRRVLLVIACGVMLSGTLFVLTVAPAILGSIAGSVAHTVANSSAVAAEVVATTARAEEMKFEPVPAESASSSDRRRTRRSAASAPAAPEAPSPLDRPRVVVGKSGDIMRVGSDVRIGPDEEVNGDVLAVGGDLTVEGHVDGNVVAMGGDIYLKTGGRVDGDVVCMGGEIHEEPGVTVGGKRVVGLGGSKIRGWSGPTRIHIDGDRHRGGSLTGALSWLLVWLLLGWAIVKVAPGRTEAAVGSFRRGPGSAFLVGWLALVLTVPALIAVVLLTALLCITIIGIPLGIAVLFGYFLFLAVFTVWGGAVGAAMIGERMAMRQGFAQPSLMRAMVTGVLVLAGAMVAAQLMRAVDFIPLFGGLGRFFWVILLIANILVGVAGWGALLHSEFTTGWLARFWNGRRGGPPPAAPPVAPPPSAPPPPSSGTSVTTVDVPPSPPSPPASASPPSPPASASPPAPPAPPSPPDSFMPPPNPPGPEATPGT